MDKDKTDAFDILKWLILMLVAIWVVWYLTGGPTRYEKESGILLKPPSPLSTGITYGKPPVIELKLPDTTNVLLANGSAVVGLKNNLRSSNPEDEYFEIVGRGDRPVNITGWKLVGTKGTITTIGQGSRLFRAGQVNQTGDIYLKKGERSIITSGNSPVGYSILINSCGGYLSQFENFSPKINSACPSPALNAILKKPNLESSCTNYLEKMPVCVSPTKTLPSNLSTTCHEFILTNASYNGCVENHQNDSNFYENGWRVYLNQSKELWESHDTIKFYDANGILIGTYSY